MWQTPKLSNQSFSVLFRSIAKLRDLEHFEFANNWSNFSDMKTQDWQYIKSIARIKSLKSFIACAPFQEAWSAESLLQTFITNNIQLEYLGLENIRLNFISLIKLVKLKTIKAVKFRHMTFDNISQSEYLNTFAQLPLLEKLDIETITYWSPRKDLNSFLSEAPNLITLYLNENLGIDDYSDILRIVKCRENGKKLKLLLADDIFIDPMIKTVLSPLVNIELFYRFGGYRRPQRKSIGGRIPLSDEHVENLVTISWNKLMEF